MSRFESREKIKNSSSFPGNDGTHKSSLTNQHISLSAPSSGASLKTLWEAGDESDGGKASTAVLQNTTIWNSLPFTL